MEVKLEDMKLGECVRVDLTKLIPTGFDFLEVHTVVTKTSDTSFKISIRSYDCER